jgi:hypothetical protein
LECFFSFLFLNYYYYYYIFIFFNEFLPLGKNAPFCNKQTRVAKVPHDSRGGGRGI